MKIVDEQGYKNGRTSFAKGNSLKSIFDSFAVRMKEIDGLSGNEKWELQDKIENYHMSQFLGYADALIEKIRSR